MDCDDNLLDAQRTRARDAARGRRDRGFSVSDHRGETAGGAYSRIIVARSFAVYEIYITAGLLYLVGTYAMLYGFRKIEHWWSGHMRERVGEVEIVATEAITVR